jgi:predicted ArsR family transcriptional regulator
MENNITLDWMPSAFDDKFPETEISVHQVLVFQALRSNNAWMTATEIAEAAKIAPRTARHHAAALVKLGILECARVFPAHRYRFTRRADRRMKPYLDQIAKAVEVFNLK